MAHEERTRLAVRAGYVTRRLPLSEAARQAGVSAATARTWKRQAKIAGDDWDTARQAARIAEGGLGGVTEEVLADFSKLFASTMSSLKSHPVEPLETARAMATLSDAYSKIVKAAGCVNPKLGRLSIALDVLKMFGEFLKEHHPEFVEPFAAALEPFGAKLARDWK